MIEFNDLKNVAWLVFLGWTIDTADEKLRGEVAVSANELKSQIVGVDIALVQPVMFDYYKQSISMSSFIQHMGTKTCEIANRAGLSRSEFYDIYTIASAEYLLNHIYPKTDTFAHAEYSDDQRKELALRFVTRLLADSLNPKFRMDMRSRMESVDSLDAGVSILERSGYNVSIVDFNRDSYSIVRVFRFGGMEDIREIFRNFKLLLAYYFCQVRS